MTAVIGNGISLRNMYVEEFVFPFYCNSAVTADDVGKAVALDTTAATTVKLAADGDAIIGYLDTFEDRTVEGIKVGAVALKGAFKFPVKSGQTVVVGDSLQGAGAGEVKALPVTDNGGTGAILNASHNRRNLVTEVGTGYAVAILF